MDSATRPNPIFWKRPWWRRFSLSLSVLLLVWLAGWLLVPVWVKDQLESGLTAQLGRRVSVGAVQFRPWSLELSVDQLAVAAADAAAGTPDSPQLAIAHIYIDASWQSLWRMAPVLDAVVVASPRIRLRYLGQGRTDLDDVLTRLKAGPSTPDQPPARFAVADVLLSDGTVTLQDQPGGRTHELTQLELKLPSLSSLAGARESGVDAALRFALNGHAMDMHIGGTPFAQQARLTAQLGFHDLDLAPYLAYLPPNLPLALRAAHLDADLGLSLEPAQPASLSLNGELAASAVRLAAPQGGAEMLGFDRLGVHIKALRPLAAELELGRVDWQGARLNVQRDRRGQLNWLTAFKPAPARPAAGAAAPAGTSPAWRLSVEQFALAGAQLTWSDDFGTRPARLRLDDLALQATALSWPMRQPVAFEGSAHMGQGGLRFQGTATDQKADLNAQVSDAPLKLLAPYLAQYLKPALDGVLTADAQLHWQAGGASADRLRLDVPKLTLDRLQLTGADKKPLARVARLELTDVRVDPQASSLQIGSARINQPSVRVTRGADGRWMVQDWLQTASTGSPTRAPAAPTAPARARAADKPWTLAVDDLRMTGGSLAWRDAAAVRPVAFDLEAVALQLRHLSTAPGKSMGVRLDARMRHGHVESGRLSWRGGATMTPLALRGTLNAERLPLHALAPYFGERLNVELRRADTSFRGEVRYASLPAGLSLQLKGDARFEDVQAFTLAPSPSPLAAQELLNLKSLSMDGVGLALQPGKPAQFEVRSTVLSDFYARITLNENGRFNLQDLLRQPEAAPAAAAASSSAPAAAQTVQGQADVAASGSGAALEPVIRLGPTSLQGGRVDFTDRFIQPNYATQLSSLTGRLGAFASQNAAGGLQLADLELRGRAEGSATLEITGKINPLARPLALDVQGRVRDLELSPLSTYAARYAGYGIERGKLSVDVAYKIDPDGQLTARNDIVLNQLKFGDAVEGAKNSLPVKLAVALLADRNGVIDINLPISGSLNDPQFRLMPIVFRMIGNLIMKAVTAPFSLLAHLFSGGADSFSAVHFAPGSAALDAKARSDLDKVAQALNERTALKMTVVASASLAQEREAFQRAQLHNLLRIEKRRRAPAATPAPDEDVSASAPDYAELLRAVYRRASFAKPRNWIGLTKDIPVADMEALLLANIGVTEADMQMLAVQRGVAVRDYLAALHLPMERLFLGAPRTQALPPDWQPQAELNLSVE